MAESVHRDAASRSAVVDTFGSRVRELRLAAGLTQAQLAEAAGVHRVTIAKVEGGRVELGLTSIHAVAGALGLTASELLGGL